MSACLSLYCRLCAEQKFIHELIDLTSDQRTLNELVEQLSIFSSHLVDFSINTLPQTVCTQCIQNLNSTHEFYTKIKISQFTLSNLVSSVPKPDSGDSDHSFDGSDTLDIKTYSELTKFEGFNNNSALKMEFKELNIKFDDTSTVTWSTYPWLCKHCNMQARNVEALREHCREWHDVCFGIRCADCGENYFSNFDEFLEHVRKHRSELNQYCQHCNVKLEPENTTDHITAHKLQPHCYICGGFFADNLMLHAHLSQYQKRVACDISWRDYDWVCRDCNTKLANQDSLRLHVKEVHKKCFGMQCADCPEILDSFNAFVDHVREHKPSLKYYCQYCNHKFLDAHYTIPHVSQHFNNQCQVCGESFPSPHALDIHKNTYNQKRRRGRCRKKTLTEKDLTCNVCHKVTKSLNNLQAHKTLHTDRKRDYTCDRCGRAFFTKGALTTHHVIHENPDPEVCKFCKKAFLTPTRLKKHAKTHYAEKKFQCDICRKCFRLKDQLKSHMACHSDVMPFACQYCQKTFRYRNVLKNHENQHTGARPYRCSACLMEFANWSNCNKHSLRKHGASLVARGAAGGGGGGVTA